MIRSLSYVALCAFAFISFPATAADCSFATPTARLAVYMDRYAYSSLDAEQTVYQTTAGVSAAWRDMYFEDSLSARYLAENGKDTTATEWRSIAAENAAIAMAQRSYLEAPLPTDDELQRMFAETSPTYSMPPYARVDFYYLRRTEDVSTSESLAQFFDEHFSTPSRTDSFFHMAAPQKITTGSATVTRGKINPELERQSFTLPLQKPTMFSGEHGWYILSVRERELAPTVPSFDDVKDDLKSAYIRRKRNALETEVQDRVGRQFPVKWTGSSNFTADELVSSPTVAIAEIGSSKILAGDFLRFLEVNGLRPIALTTETLATKLDEYVFRRGVIELARADGLTSTCLYKIILDLGFNKALAARQLDSRFSGTAFDATETELRDNFEELRERLRIGEQYGVIDFWTTAPTEADIREIDQLYLKREAVRKRMTAFRDAVSSAGLNPNTLPEMDRRFGPFMIQDYGVAPQGPRGYLLDTTVQNLEVGEFSPVVEDARSFHFYLLNKKVPGRPLTYEESRKRLSADIANQKRDAAVMQLLDQATVAAGSPPADAHKLLDSNFRNDMLDQLADTPLTQ